MPPSPERSRESRELDETSRERLIFNLAEHTYNQKLDLERRPNWPQLGPYVELIGMMGILQGQNPKNNDEGYSGPTLAAKELTHLHKMVALQTRFVPKERIPGAKKFWEEIESEVGKEMARVSTFRDDFEHVPKSYKEAVDDLSSFKVKLLEIEGQRSTMQLMEALRKSIATRREAKS